MCVTDLGEIVVISEREGHWNLPGGRPELGESWEDTMRREALEEGCAIVGSARLLGIARSRCLDGREQGLVLVRSFWRADVELLPWTDRFEMVERRLINADQVLTTVTLPAGLMSIVARAIHEAGVPGGRP